MLQKMASEMGLKLNVAKCKVINVTVFMVWRRSKGAIARWRVGADMSRRERTIAGERERM